MLDRLRAAGPMFGIAVCMFVFSFSPATAQQKSAAPPAQGCEQGFERREYPHGSEVNFRCRTRVIDCPERKGLHVVAIPEPVFETAQCVQFGYRCNYTSRDR
jgi:hypothetical protein